MYLELDHVISEEEEEEEEEEKEEEEEEGGKKKGKKKKKNEKEEKKKKRSKKISAAQEDEVLASLQNLDLEKLFEILRKLENQTSVHGDATRAIVLFRSVVLSRGYHGIGEELDKEKEKKCNVYRREHYAKRDEEARQHHHQK